MQKHPPNTNSNTKTNTPVGIPTTAIKERKA
ncbi:hypothetical protein GGE09_001545 [Roseobacter sp. N2S]|nr:hypothetical protein [Roseobacter sp. N2S]